MVKRIIFDVDDTLIKWKEKYWCIEKLLKELNIPFSIKYQKTLKDAYNYCENKLKYYDEEIFNKTLLNYLNQKEPHNLLYVWNKLFSNQVDLREGKKVNKVLKKLSVEYDLVILTNSFYSVQSSRLNKLDMLKYFSQVYAPESFKAKPHKEAFKTACGHYKYDECLMVGDNIDIDIKPAQKLGMKTFLVDSNNSIEKLVKDLKEGKI